MQGGSLLGGETFGLSLGRYILLNQLSCRLGFLCWCSSHSIAPNLSPPFLTRFFQLRGFGAVTLTMNCIQHENRQSRRLSFIDDRCQDVLLVLNFFAVTHSVLGYTVARLRVLFYKAKKIQRIQKYIKHLQNKVLEKQFSKWMVTYIWRLFVL